MHVRRIQDEELAVTNQFSLALSSLATKSHEKRRMREDVAREVYQKKIAKIREKRKRYREMMYDALAERKKLIDSMQIQKDEDDILRRKLAKLSALSASETSREQRKTSAADKFAWLFIVLQVSNNFVDLSSQKKNHQLTFKYLFLNLGHDVHHLWLGL